MDQNRQIEAMKDLLCSGSPGDDARRSFSIDGKSCIDVVPLWDGILLWANEIHRAKLSYPVNVYDNNDYLLLNICHKGRCEVELKQGKFVYMSPGILNVSASTPKNDYYYPGSLYRGIEICFNMQVLRDKMPEALSSYGFDFSALEKYAGEENLLAMLSGSSIQEEEKLFNMIRGKTASLSEIRFAVLVLIYHLTHGGCTRIENCAMISKGQRKIANEVEQMLCSDLQKHYTTEDIASLFGISPSALKKYFIAVYGRPVFQYMREKRLKNAMSLLSGTNKSVGEIASACGYEHQGKFGTAFKEFTGVSPLEYRRLNKTMQR